LNAAFLDYGLLEAGVDAAARPELFIGFDYSSLYQELVDATARLFKIEDGSDPDDSHADILKAVAELEKPAKEAEKHRHLALLALRKKDRHCAPKEFAEFFQQAKPLAAAFHEVVQSWSEELGGEDQTGPEFGNREESDDGTKATMQYAAIVLDAWARRDPGRLRSLLTTMEETGPPTNIPLLLSAGYPAQTDYESSLSFGTAEDTYSLRLAMERGRAPKGFLWPRLVSLYAAATGDAALRSAAVETDDPLSASRTAEFEIAYAGQLALEASGEISHVRLVGADSFGWLMKQIRDDAPLFSSDIEMGSKSGLQFRMMQVAYMSSNQATERLSANPMIRSVMDDDPELPDFESVTPDEDTTEKAAQDSKANEDKVATKANLPAKLTLWSLDFPLLLNAIVHPEDIPR
jgi:hypothetical protein